MSQSNPYQAPGPEGPSPAGFAGPKPVLFPPHATRTAINWGESLNFVFREPQWMMTLLLGAVCQLIPVLGPLVFLGYQFEVEIDLTMTQGAGYRPFDFGRFTAYLKRGLMPFLVAMCAGLVLVPVLYIVMIVGFLLVAVAARAAGDAGPIVAIVAGALGFVLYLGLIAGLNLVLPPMMLRAAMTQQFSEGFNLGFVRDFAGRVRNELLLAFLFQMFVGMALGLLGMLLCFVGIYPAVVVALLLQAHLQFQLYELYRARGGESLPITSVD